MEHPALSNLKESFTSSSSTDEVHDASPQQTRQRAMYVASSQSRSYAPTAAASQQVLTTQRQALNEDANLLPPRRNYSDYMRMLCAELGRLKTTAQQTLAARDNMLATNNHHLRDDHSLVFEKCRLNLHYALDRIYRLLEQSEMALRTQPFD